MAPPESLREVALAEWMRLLDSPYKWGGEGTAVWDVQDYGVDCSGFVRRGLVPVGILPADQDLSAHAMFTGAFKGLPRITDQTKLRRGMLVFYARTGKVHHVEVVLGAWPGPKGWQVLTIGAARGDSTTTTIEAAAARDAKVLIHPLPTPFLAAIDPFQGAF